MRDIYLWERLLAQDLDPAEATESLEELAKLSPARRVPFWGLVGPYLSAEDDRLRSAATRVLAGARGFRGIREQVRLLDDPAPEVREAAVESLRQSSDGPGRWAHVLFHSNAPVRRLAVGTPPPAVPAALPLALLADSATKDLVHAQLDALVSNGSVVPLLLSFVRSGDLPPETLRDCLLADWVRQKPGLLLDPLPVTFGFPTVRIELEQYQTVRDAFVGYDVLDHLLEFFWAAPDDAFFELLAETFRQERLSLEQERRIAWSLARVGRGRSSTWSPWRLALLASVMPIALADPDIALDVRRAAARLIPRVRGKSKLDNPLNGIATGPVLRPKSGLDLAAAVGVASRCTGFPFDLLHSYYGKELHSAVHRKPEASLGLFGLTYSSKAEDAYRRLLERYLDVDHPPERLAELALLLRREALGLVAERTPKKLVSIVAALLQLEGEKRLRLNANRRKRLLEELAPTLARTALADSLRLLLTQAPLGTLGFDLLFEIAVHSPPAGFSLGLSVLDPPLHHRFVALIEDNALFPLVHLQVVARAMKKSGNRQLEAWANSVLEPARMTTTPTVLSGKSKGKVRSLKRKDRKRISSCKATDLPKVLELVYDAPTLGICDALNARKGTEPPSCEVVVALLLSHDLPERVAGTVPRFAENTPAFWSEVDRLMVQRASGSSATSWLACAWLFRWERRLLQFARVTVDTRGGLVAVLRESLRWSPLGQILTDHVWSAVARLLAIWKARDKPTFFEHVDRELAELAVAALPRMQARAASILVQLHQAAFDRSLMDSLQGRVLPMLHALDASCRRELSRWFDLEGLSSGRAAPPSVEEEAVNEALESVRGAELDRLRDWLLHRDPRVVDEALKRLEDAGDVGRLLVLDALEREPPLARRLAEPIMTWPEGELLAAAARLCGSETLAPATRFSLALAMLWRGRKDAWHWVYTALVTDSDYEWLLPSSYEEVQKAAGAMGLDRVEVAAALVISPYSAVYVPALTDLLLVVPPPAAPLRRFLDTGTNRLASLRRRVARALHEQGDFSGFPILFSEALVDSGRRKDGGAPWLLKRAPPELVELCGRCFAMAGPALVPPKNVLDELDTGGLDPLARERAWNAILHATTNAAVHERIFSRMRLSRARYDKLQRLAETFAWGVQQGVRLTGRKFGIRMIGGDAFANTRLTTSSININPLPLLRGERDGRTVVEGLILHELGHHVHHAGNKALGIWNRAQQQGLHKLLNLVADEHLERNIRAEREEDGNRLKTLATYAFQRRQSEIPVESLLQVLGFRAFEVLKSARLEVARDPNCVELKMGETLRALEANGSSFTRFFRALRMGLGNRHDDPKVEEALALFHGAQFRRSDMNQLWIITQKLHAIFGDEVRQLDVFDQHTEWGDDTDARIHGDGISDEEVQRAIDRILDPKSGRESNEPPREFKPAMNLGSEDSFNKITSLEQVAPDPDAHRLRAQKIQRMAKKMRDYLERLGLSLRKRGGRVRGFAVDRERIRGMVLHGDPRVLRSRELRRDSDLFLGVIVDCSGSMAAGDSMEKAKLFGVLLAEATKGMANIETRFWGFTDRVIYEAGNANRCAVASLVANGGNNDAAALWHAAQVAFRSRRRAKLLVMISDGAPTECTVESLRSLVNELTRRHNMACAQIAVRPIDEVCFPHYVEITEGEIESAVRKFGNVAAHLVSRTLGR